MNPITHCICEDIPLADLPARYATPAAARRATGCGETCGLCIPHVEATFVAQEATRQQNSAQIPCN